MGQERDGQIAVIFMSVRTAEDDAGYRAAAAEMEGLADQQPGYRGMISTRGPDGLGITVSYWEDEASAVAWRDNPRHRAVRDAGRGRWYARYTIDIAHIQRSYNWSRDD